MEVQQSAVQPSRSVQIWTFQDLSRIIIRRKYGILTAILIASAGAMASHMLKAPEYRAVSILMINDDKSENDLFSKVVGPEASTGEHKSLNRDVELLRSMTIAEMTVRELEKDSRRSALELFGQKSYRSPLKRMFEPVISPVASVFAALSPHSAKNSEAELSLLAAKLSRRISVTPVRESNVIKVSVASPFADESALLTNTLCKVYREADIRRTSEKYAQANRFIAQMLDEQAQKLAEADAALSRYMLNHEIYEVTGNTRDLLDKLVEVDAVYNELQAEHHIERNRLAFLEGKLTEADKALTSRISRNVAAQLGTIVEEIRSNESDYFRSVKEKGVGDPESKMLKKRLDAVKERYEQLSRSKIAGQIGYAGQTQKSGFEMVSEKLRIERRLNDLNYSAKEYGRMKQYYEGQLSGLPVKLQEYVKLERDREAVSKTYVFLKEKLDESRILIGSEVGTVSVVGPASSPLLPATPALSNTILLGILFSVLFASVYTYAAESGDDTLHDDSFFRNGMFRRIFMIPFLQDRGSVFSGTGSLAAGDVELPPMLTEAPFSPFAERFRILRTGLDHESAAGNRTMLVSATGSGEGASSVSLNLALAWAQAGRRTVLVDCNMRSPSVHRVFGCRRESGLADYLTGQVQDAASLLQHTGIPGLSMVSAGRVVWNPSELFGIDAMRQLLEMLKTRFDRVVLDCPPLSTSDSVQLVDAVDGIILAARFERSGKQRLRAAAGDWLFKDKILCLAVIESPARDTVGERPSHLDAAEDVPLLLSPPAS